MSCAVLKWRVPRAMAVSIVNIIDDFLTPNSVLKIVFNIAGSPAFLAVLGARLLLNMKEAGAKGFNPDTSYDSKSTASGVIFASPSVVATTSQSQHNAAVSRNMLEIKMQEYF